MINILNETELHRSLKTLYSVQNEGSKTEEKAGRYIADIVKKDGGIIEIQTGSLGHLAPKIKFYLQEKRKVTVVYPLARTKYIETRIPEENKVTRRKSPLTKSIWSVFRELTALTDFLCSRNFTLEVIECTITEERTRTEEPVQSANGRRRFRRNWIKTGKRLDEASGTISFHGKASWKKFLPKTEGAFTVKMMLDAARETEPKAKESEIRTAIWVLTRAGILETAGKEGRKNLYKPAE